MVGARTPSWFSLSFGKDTNTNVGKSTGTAALITSGHMIIKS